LKMRDDMVNHAALLADFPASVNSGRRAEKRIANGGRAIGSRQWAVVPEPPPGAC
jgi:hypothetical protein